MVALQVHLVRAHFSQTQVFFAVKKCFSVTLLGLLILKGEWLFGFCNEKHDILGRKIAVIASTLPFKMADSFD